jgi:plastocyanin
VRSRHLAAVAVLASALSPAAARAADWEVVTTSSDQFSPSNLAIEAGDKVTFRNTGGQHNVKFEDGRFEQPSEPSILPWRVSRGFGTSGNFPYYCEEHGGPGGVGMSGVIVVAPPGTFKDTQDPVVSSARFRPRRRHKVSISFSVSEGGRATVTLERRVKDKFRPTRSIVRNVGAGVTRLTVAKNRRGHPLRPGRYRGSVSVRDVAGNISIVRRDRFTLD